jgi:hypothetical protein
MSKHTFMAGGLDARLLQAYHQLRLRPETLPIYPKRQCTIIPAQP